MSRSKRSDAKRAAADDDLLMRALRQLADEALEEEIPERLLRPLREAREPPQAGGEARPEAETACPPRAGEAATRQPRSSRGRAGSS
jgi:hypothetical protein